jgi:hypothetical protein
VKAPVEQDRRHLACLPRSLGFQNLFVNHTTGGLTRANPECLNEGANITDSE